MIRSDVDLAFVISAGRTGTVHLTSALQRSFPQVRAVHEPAGSRRLLMLANASHWLGAGRDGVARRFTDGLTRRLDGLPAGTLYVEINPMLCGLTDVLARLPRPFALVHAVRDPRTWVPSIRKFKASGYRRHLIDHVPFANPVPSPRPAGWLWTSQETRALWRWRYCNEQILALRPHAKTYATVRYEDLYGPERDGTLRALTRALGLPEEGLQFDATERVNPAPPGERVVVPEDEVVRVCGPLLSAFGYG